eukprot:113098-Amphidinium_carterae.1
MREATKPPAPTAGRASATAAPAATPARSTPPPLTVSTHSHTTKGCLLHVLPMSTMILQQEPLTATNTISKR